MTTSHNAMTQQQPQGASFNTLIQRAILVLLVVAWRWGTWVQIAEFAAWWVLVSEERTEYLRLAGRLVNNVALWTAIPWKAIAQRGTYKTAVMVDCGVQTDEVESMRTRFAIPKASAFPLPITFGLPLIEVRTPEPAATTIAPPCDPPSPVTASRDSLLLPLWETTSDSASTLVNPESVDGDCRSLNSAMADPEWKEAVGMITAMVAAAKEKDENCGILEDETVNLDDIPDSVVPSSISDADPELISYLQTVHTQHSTDPIIKSFTPHHLTSFLTAARTAKATNPISEALKNLQTTLHWRSKNNFFDILSEDFSDLEATQKLYFHPRKSKDGTPILVWRAARHNMCKDESELARTVRFLVSTIENARSSGLLTQRATILVCRRHIKPENKDPALLKLLLSTFQTHYPEHLEKLYIFPRTVLLSIGWNVAKVFLGGDVRGRVEILGGEWKEVLKRDVGIAGLGGGDE